MILPLALALMAPQSAPPPLAGVKIVVDPGHPSENGVGTRGQTLTELEVCWKVGLSLKEYLRRRGAEVKLTKATQNQVVTNRARAEVGNTFGANYVVRLHCDAASERGFATFYPARTGTVNGVTGPSAAVLAKSKEYAQVFHSALAESLEGELSDRGLRTEQQTAVGARQGALSGSIHSRVPVVLVEMVVLTQRADEQWMSSRQNQLKYAEALAKAVEKVFSTFPVSR
ncbi:MAG: N-acetylmuramoyl-L-alanine amidase [Fimbriimonadaceae bacterium]|nr:N-acetylmuramoyl-L-alanine amidase [Fimbriimonadaceae bacterium]